jgi:hypothetical protein
MMASSRILAAAATAGLTLLAGTAGITVAHAHAATAFEGSAPAHEGGPSTCRAIGHAIRQA